MRVLLSVSGQRGESEISGSNKDSTDFVAGKLGTGEPVRVKLVLATEVILCRCLLIAVPAGGS